MAWNQPGNNGQDRDPWGSGKGNNSGNSGGNNQGGRNQGSPSVDDLFRKLNNWFGKIGSGGSNSGSGGNNNNNMNSATISRMVGIALAIAVAIWGISGFYTIQEGESGVLTRFGKLQNDKFIGSGLHWKPRFIDEVIPVDISTRRSLETRGVMLTADENVVQVSMSVEYNVEDPARFLFSVTDANNSLRQATDSALRAVIGKYSMDRILTEGRQVVRDDTQRELIKIIEPYNMGLRVVNVNLQAARPPEEVKAAFDDAIAAREDEQRFIVESKTYANQVQPRANGDARRLLEDARAYRERVVLEARGEVAKFEKLLPEYLAAPEVTRQRLYLETMEKVLGRSNKVLMNNDSSNLMVLPLDQMIRGKNTSATQASQNVAPSLSATGSIAQPVSPTANANVVNQNNSTAATNDLTAGRSDSVRRGRQ